MNRFKCPACGGNQYTSADTAEGCIYCGNKELKKMEILEPKEGDEMREIKFRRNDIVDMLTQQLMKQLVMSSKKKRNWIKRFTT